MPIFALFGVTLYPELGKLQRQYDQFIWCIIEMYHMVINDHLKKI